MLREAARVERGSGREQRGGARPVDPQSELPPCRPSTSPRDEQDAERGGCAGADVPAAGVSWQEWMLGIARARRAARPAGGSGSGGGGGRAN